MNNVNIIENDIPTLDKHNHASNLFILKDGDLLCTWFSGSNEGRSDIKIVISQYSITDGIWGKPKYITSDNTRSEQNPILYRNTDGNIWLLYTSQDGIHQNSSIVKYAVSRDEGQTWSDSEILFNTPGSFIRNPPVILGDKTIILPAYYSIKSENGLFGDDYSVVKISNDHGQSWIEHKIENSEGLVHPSLVNLGGNLVVLFRSRKADYIYTSISYNLGESWTSPKPIDLPNNNSSIQSKKIGQKSILIAYNDVNALTNPPDKNMPPWFDEKDLKKAGVDIHRQTDIIWGTIRNPLSLSISHDGGENWKHLLKVQESIEEDGKDEYSYPSIIETENGDIHITYTFQRKFIKHKIIKKGDEEI